MNITTPIIVFDEDRTVFLIKNTTEVDSYIEPYDIDIYKVFDWEGKKLKLKKYMDESFNRERVEIQIADDIVSGKQELYQNIIEWLKSIRKVNNQEFIQRDWDNYSLDELLEMITELKLFDNRYQSRMGCLGFLLPRKRTKIN